MRDLTYPVVIAAAKTWFKLGDIDVRMEGTEHIPREGGALLAVNHVSYVDYVMAGYPGVEQGRLTRFMAKREVFDHPVGGPVMRSFKHISVDRSAGLASMDEAAKFLRRGEVVGIFPEATISRSFLIKELKTGAVRIAAKAEVPLIPVVLWGTQRIFTKDHPKDFGRHKTILVRVGEPLHPTNDRPAGRDPRAAQSDGGPPGRRHPRLPGRGAAARLLVAPRVVRRLRADAGGGRGHRRGREARAREKRAKKARAKAAKKRG